MKKEFIVERQGRAFVLYAGLLDLAHTQGLKSIRTEMIQQPTEANNRIAICMATVVLEKDGVERTFTGIGDAAPNNVAPAMATCLIRMAETRSKARALRDAVNVGVAAFEELGEEDAHDGAPDRGYRTNAPARSQGRMDSRERSQSGERQARAPRPNPDLNTLRISDAQLEAIRSTCKRQGIELTTVAQEAGVALDNLTQAQAAKIISDLNRKKEPVGR